MRKVSKIYLNVVFAGILAKTTFSAFYRFKTQHLDKKFKMINIGITVGPKFT